MQCTYLNDLKDLMKQQVCPLVVAGLYFLVAYLTHIEQRVLKLSDSYHVIQPVALTKLKAWSFCWWWEKICTGSITLQQILM